MSKDKNLDQLSINTIRTPSMDGIEQASSGASRYAGGDGAHRVQFR